MLPSQVADARSDWREVFLAFLRLGCTSFGGPVAHLAYFRAEFVSKRAWLDDASYAQLVALSQIVPGPASSQVGFSLGLLRAGWRGALAAFAGFTLPSALLMLLLALVMPGISGSATGLNVLHGLKLLAIIVVAHALWGMSRALASDLRRGLVALGAACVLLLAPRATTQLAIIALGGLVGALTLHADTRLASPPCMLRWHGIAATAALVIGLAWALLAVPAEPTLGSVAAAHFRAGALVFGGGHVVLPLLEEQLVSPGWLSTDQFLSGYGAAQAVPGPLFTIASFLGASVHTGHPQWLGALVATLAMFAPGFLVLIAALPFWHRFIAGRRVGGAISGIGAAVVGMLGATLYSPLITEGLRGAWDASIVLIGVVIWFFVPRPILIALPLCVLGAAFSR